jgi:predicted TIM-barrel fold metal-dependent hydrolase
MRTVAAILAVAVATGCAGSRPGADQSLAAYVDTLSAIDSHAHPLAFTAPAAPADSESDALPLAGLPPFDVPLGLRPTNPRLADAQRALYGSTAGADSAGARAFEKTRTDQIAKLGEGFPVWVLDQLHIQVMLANRIAMGAGLQPPRFRWVAFADPLMLPLDVRSEAERTPDTKALYPLSVRLLLRYLGDLGLSKVPATLDTYQRGVVTATLERQHSAGAVATKFEAAYLRSLDFEPADSAAAAAVYRRYAAGGVPTRAEYKLLEDYLVRYIAREAGRLGMAVQFHSADGFGGSYSAAGAAPHNLESLFSDPALRETRFVVVHGGWPLVAEMMSLLGKPNVYADVSVMDQIAGRADLAATIRTWLTSWPEKVLFGTDAFDGGAVQGWEQVAWVATHNARRALSDALDGMVRDGEITVERARRLARMVIRDNAAAAYRLGS